MNHHNAIDRFAQRGLKAQASVDEVIQKISQRPVASSPKSGSTAGTPPVAATQGKRDAEGSPPDSPTSRPALSGEVTIQQIRWSNDERWLQRLMVDKDRTPAIRQAAQMRLRKLGRRKPRL